MNFSVVNFDQLVSHVENNLHIIDEDFSITLKGNDNNLITFKIKKGAKCDGLSIPAMFTWFLLKWDNNNALYNIAGILHDGLYASELVSKNIADDMFRGILRDAGISRFKASTAEWCVEKFAKRHYGKKHDEYNMQNFIELTSISCL